MLAAFLSSVLMVPTPHISQNQGESAMTELGLGMESNPLRVGVVMWYVPLNDAADNVTSTFGYIANEINNFFALRKGFTMIEANYEVHKDRHRSWEKIAYMKRALKSGNYDIVMWIDADACFEPQNGNVLDELFKTHSNADIVFASNIPFDSGLNTGIMFARPSERAIDFFDQVDHAGSKSGSNLPATDSTGRSFDTVAELCAFHMRLRQWEQECVKALVSVNYNNIQDTIAIEPKLATILDDYHPEAKNVCVTDVSDFVLKGNITTPVVHWARCSQEDRNLGMYSARESFRGLLAIPE